jgi:hypothetical protein
VPSFPCAADIANSAVASIDHDRLCAEACAGVTEQAQADVIAGIDRKGGAKEAAWPHAVGS